MAQEIEIEFKNLLTSDEYDRIEEYLPFESVELIEQTNYYFETGDFLLRNQGAALRIRKKNNQWTLTLKQPHDDGLLETHDHLTEQEAEFWIQNKPVEKSNVSKQLKELGVLTDDLSYLGFLTTKRKEVEFKQTTVVLDHSLYYNQEDFELELEASTKEHGEAVFIQLLKDCNISKRKTDNKIKRFYKAKLETD